MNWTETILPGGWTEYSGDGGGTIRFFNGKFASVNPPPRFYEASEVEHALAIREKGERQEPLHEDEAGLQGRDSEIVAEVLEDHSLVAIRFLEAMHRGDAGYFRGMYDALRDRKKELDAMRVIDAVAEQASKGDESAHNSQAYIAACIALETKEGRATELEILKCAIGSAARKCGGVPTVELVAERYESIRVPRYQGLIYSSDPRGSENVSAAKLPTRSLPKKSDKPKQAVAKSRRLETIKAKLKDIGFGWLPYRSRGDCLKRK